MNQNSIHLFDRNKGAENFGVTLRDISLKAADFSGHDSFRRET